MSREKDIAAQMTAMGVYDPAFDPEIHTLCIMERELSRAMKAWKQTAPDKNSAPDPTHELYEVISRLRRDILQHRDALGLTPKGLQRLRKAQAAAPANEAVTGTANPAFAALMNRIQEASHVGTE